ncbi:MAG: DUF554 family protein [Actinomycetota bacterium]
MRGLGTLLNIATVALGTTAGVVLGGRLPLQIRATVMQGLGLFTLFLGVREATNTHNALLLLGALLGGGLLGELLGIEERLAAVGARIERRVNSDPDDRSRFVEGFLVASLVFCVGPLTILGSIQDGLGEDIDLLATKSVLDCFAALAFAATLGWGVDAARPGRPRPVRFRPVARPICFEHNRYLGDKRTQMVYDLDLIDADTEVAAAVDDIMAAETFLAFGPDTLAEARNRCFRPHRSIARAAG